MTMHIIIRLYIEVNRLIRRSLKMNLLTVQDLCERLNCEPSYVYRLVHERRIPFLKLGHRKLRFNPVQVDAWIDQRIVDIGIQINNHL